MTPRISVIMPIGDRIEFLAQAIDSVLAQTFTEFELIAVLDGVSEPVHALVAGYSDERIRIIRMPINLGVSNARNAGLRAARAPYAALMDSDDVAMPYRFAVQHAWMENHPELTVCGSNSVKVMDTGQRLSMRYPETDAMIKARLLLVDSALLNPTAMMRMDFIRHHGLQYDANMPRDQDHRFFVEALRLGARFHGIQQELLLYRRHAGNATKDRSRVDIEKSRVREVLLPVFFPELSGHDYRMLLKGLAIHVQMTLDEACHFLHALNRAASENRVFAGEDRTEIRRILSVYRARVLKFIKEASAAQPPDPAGAAN